MMPIEPATAPTAARGSFRLGRVAGTDVFVHWSWFVAAYFLYRDGAAEGASPTWAAAEYVAGFVLVLLHEFGHVLACRQTGGTADRVVLWPLGGLAFVVPPPRPGALLWTVVAGPLVNVVLLPVLYGLAAVTTPADGVTAPGLNAFLAALAMFNLGLLIFNLLPIYPLDGGRILEALLWWPFGRPAALYVAAGIGVVAAAGLGVLAVGMGEAMLAVLAAFLGFGALGGLGQARLLTRLKRAERRDVPA